MNNTNNDLDNGNSRALSRNTSSEAGSARDLAYEDKAMRAILGIKDEAPSSLLDYARGMLNYKWVILTVTLLAIVISIAYAYTRTPYYVSSATVEVQKFPHSTSNNLADLYENIGRFDVHYRTQVQALMSRDVAKDFLANTDWHEITTPGSPWRMAVNWVRGVLRKWRGTITGKSDHKSLSAAPTELVEEMKKESRVGQVLAQVSVTPMEGTQMVRVQMGANDPLTARRMLRAYLDSFLKLSHKKRGEAGSKARGWLRHELEQTERVLKKSETELLAFTKEHGIVFVEQNPNQAVSFFKKASESFIRDKTNLVQMEADARARTDTPDKESEFSHLENLKAELAELKSKHEDMKAIYSPNYFKLAFMRRKIEAIEKAIADIEQGSLSNKLEVARSKEEVSRELFEKSKKDAISTNSLQVQYEILRKAMEANAKVYLMVLQRFKQAEIDHGMTANSVVINSAPTLPMVPTHPNKTKILTFGAVFGVVGGLALAMLLGVVDDKVRTTKEIQQGLDLPILGSVPKLNGNLVKPSGRNDEPSSLEFMAHQFPSSSFTEAVRIVQTNATSFLRRDAGITLAISSALPTEGKTLLCVLMGSLLASEGKKVLIIDGDMRRPRIHKVFKQDPNVPGLAELISEEGIRLNQVVRKSHVSGLYYMVAGVATNNPASSLKGDRFDAVLDACRKVFDVVMIDTPPLLGVVDARVLSGNADGLIMVAKAGHTPMRVLRQAKDAVVQAGLPLIGIVLNMADPNADGYSYYYSKYYHGYHNNEPRSKPKK